jgi:hypothetical protein
MDNLASSLGGQGKHEEAEQMERVLLDVRRRVLGPEDPGTLATMNNLACSSRTQTTSRPADSEDEVQSHEPRTSSARPDPHPDAPPAKRARR